MAAGSVRMPSDCRIEQTFLSPQWERHTFDCLGKIQFKINLFPSVLAMTHTMNSPSSCRGSIQTLTWQNPYYYSLLHISITPAAIRRDPLCYQTTSSLHLLHQLHSYEDTLSAMFVSSFRETWHANVVTCQDNTVSKSRQIKDGGYTLSWQQVSDIWILDICFESTNISMAQSDLELFAFVCVCVLVAEGCFICVCGLSSWHCISFCIYRLQWQLM